MSGTNINDSRVSAHPGRTTPKPRAESFLELPSLLTEKSVHIPEGDRKPKAKHLEARDYTYNTYSRHKQTPSCAQLASTLSSQPGHLAQAWPDPIAPSNPTSFTNHKQMKWPSIPASGC